MYAGTWVGAISGQDEQAQPLAVGCAICHNDTLAPDNFTPWMQSGHATVFSNNLNNNEGYKESCFACHTVGYNVDASNEGFDDTPDYGAFLNSNVLSSPDEHNWADMLSQFPQTASLASVQCENCHGPNQGALPHPNIVIDAVRDSLSAGVCATCHGQSLEYGRFQEWASSAHADSHLALDEATVESRGVLAAHCGRYHSAQGFITWLSQGDLTERIQGASGDASVAELTAMGLTQEEIQPQTCALCHDPHQSGQFVDGATAGKVRVGSSTGLLPAGFQARNVGNGVICITCHNTRNGSHNDANPPTSYSSPHSAAQGDVLLGENAYFVPRQRSPHSFVKDTCTACHMTTIFPAEEISYETPGRSHTFEAKLDVCADCHSATLDALAFEETHQAHMEELARLMGDYLMSRLPEQISVRDVTPHEYTGRAYDLKSEEVIISKNNIVSAEPSDAHGQQGFVLHLSAPVSVTYQAPGESPHDIAVTEIQVQLGDILAGGKAVIPVSDILVKVGWNFHLIHRDSSFAVHNPAWVN